MKRLLSVFLSLSLLCGLSPRMGEAATSFIKDSKDYREGPVVINVQAEAKSDSRATSSDGSSGFSQCLKLCAVAIATWYACKFKDILSEKLPKIKDGVKDFFVNSEYNFEEKMQSLLNVTASHNNENEGNLESENNQTINAEQNQGLFNYHNIKGVIGQIWPVAMLMAWFARSH